jgi:hypothetical protein
MISGKARLVLRRTLQSSVSDTSSLNLKMLSGIIYRQLTFNHQDYLQFRWETKNTFSLSHYIIHRPIHTSMDNHSTVTIQCRGIGWVQILWVMLTATIRYQVITFHIIQSSNSTVTKECTHIHRWSTNLISQFHSTITIFP